ncbi:MAG: hypothetical protein DCC55_34155, partial [Chloroflexi bacterium]
MTRAPFGVCDARAFLFQDNPSNGYAVNLVTGAAPLIFPNMANLTNGIGYNQVDNFIWGSCLWGCPTTGTASDPGYLTRVGAGGGNVDIGPIPGLPGTYHIGDVHPDGLLYLTDNGDRMYVVDLRPTSLTYLTVITETVFSGSDGNPNQPGTNLGGADWAFHPGDGQLYSVIRELDPNNNDIRYSRLLRINPATGQITNLGRLRNNANTANINFGPSTTGWGAMYFDSAGYLYISENGTGRIHRVDITDPSLPNNYRAVLFANGPSSTSNDGARCNAAPLPVDFGDAPDSYGTLLDSAGARHAVPTYNSANQTANLMLGSRIDIESDGQPTADANGDNNNGIDDEDGIGVVPPFNPGMGSYSTQVLVSNTTGNIARLCGYLDADDGTEGFNGSFNSGNERACVDVPNAPDPQVVTLNWSNLALSTAATETYLRLRLGTVAAEVGSPAGPASDGEVEDYLVSTGLNCGTGTAQTISGYAQAWTPDSTWQTATGNHARLAINAPDGQGVQVYQAQDNVLTLDMATVVPVGQVVTLYLSQPANDAFRGNVLIESSADGVTFGSPATYTPGATLPAYEPFSYSVPVGGARFIRITPQDNGQSGTAVRVDGLRYSFQYCECAAAINYVQQPSFEEFPQCSLQSGVFGNWQVIQNNVHIWGQNCTLGWVAPHGLNTVDLDGGTTGGIEQMLTGLNPGQRYNLTFYMGFNPAAGADSASMRVQVGDFDEIYTSASNATTGGFNRVYVEFTAQSSSETLRFVSLTGSGGPTLLNGGGAPGFGVVIDDVRVTTKYCDDYGDAPFSYGSAAHMAIGALLGLLRDTEQTDQPTPGADGDDLNGVDDEDGVTLPAVLAPGQTITVPVTVSGGSSLLQAWIDWNGNGVFDPAEQIATDLAVSSGTNNIDVTVPDDAVLDTTYARFRLSTQSGLGPTGPAPDGEVEDYLLTIAIPSLSASKRATLQSDADGNGFASPGDTLRYTIEIVNGGAGTALGVVYTDLPDLNTALAVGSVTTSQGAVTTGNTAGDSTVAVDIGDIASGGVVSIVYDVTINNPVAAGVTQVVNQGIVDPQNPDIPDLLTDDPDTPVPGDPTVVPIVAAPVVNAYKSATLAVDADGDGAPSPGDTLLYTIQIINSGNQDAPAVVLNDLLDAKTTLNVGSVTTDLGTVMAGNSAGDTHVEVAVGDLPGGGTQATITYQVTINNPLPAGATQVSNQGIVSSPDPNVPDILTDCTDTPLPDDACDVPVVAQPVVNAYKTATLAVDADGDGVPSPGDTLLYTIQIRNSGNQDAPGLDFLDHPDANTTLVVGSVASDRGTVTSGNTGGDMSVAVDIGTLPGGGGQANISYRVTINNPLPAGVTQVSNQGIVSSPDPNVPDILTDCTDTPELDDACDVPVVSEPVVKAYKKATLAVDADGNGVPSPGDTLLYTLQIINSGNAAAPGLSFSDSPDANTQLIVGSVSTSYGTITRGNTAGDTGIAVDIGTLPGGGAQVEFSFRVTIDNPLPAGVTQVANQGIVSSTDPSIPDVPTDDPEDPTSDDPTDVVIEARPVLDAFKRATLFTDADGNGFPSPGDTLLYTIQLFNHGNAAAPDVRFSDIPDANTLLVVGSVGTSLGTVTTGNTAGDTSIVVDIGTLPGRGVVEISYRVTVVNPLPAGVSRVLNQGVISTSDPNLPDVLTDDTATPTPEDSTEVWLTAEPLLRATKADTLFVDADGNGVPSPGDTLLYNVTVVNIGNGAATGVRFIDTPDANTSMVTGSVSSNRGSVSTGNNSGDTTVAVEVGVLPAGERLDVSYQAVIHNPLPGGVTQVANQGMVHSDNDANPCPDLPLAAEVQCPQLPTDDPSTLIPHDPTVTQLAALPDLVASKRDTLVVDVGGDQTVTPGDTLLYTVLVYNQGNIAATDVVFTDLLDPNTTLVAGSVQTTGGTVTRGNNSGDRSIEI